jgi:hypothetical protein
VTVLIPELIPEKSADKETYMVGEDAHYTVKVSQDKEGITAYNVVIRDEITAQTEGYAIKEDSIVIRDKDGKDITEEIRKEEDGISIEKDSIEIHTHKDLATGEFVTLNYDVSFDSTFAGYALSNIVKAKADNAPEVNADELVNIPDENGLLGVKTSDPESGSTPVAPTVHNRDGFLSLLKSESDPGFDIRNVLVAFDEHGELALVRRFYVPWQ